MISIATNQEKIGRKLQIEDTKQLLNSLKNGGNFMLSKDLISEFSRKYSSIAAERILKYHFGTAYPHAFVYINYYNTICYVDDCINNFIIENSLNNSCIIKESSNIIKQFKEQFGDYKNTLNNLIQRINWNTRAFSDFSQLKLVDKEISLHLKSKTIKLIEKKLQNCFETLGLITFYDMKLELSQFDVPETIPYEDYVTIFQEQYIIFM